MRRTNELMQLGFKNLDAFHLATAEGCAAIFVTVDLRLRRKATANAPLIRVVSPVTLLQEVIERKI